MSKNEQDETAYSDSMTSRDCLIALSVVYDGNQPDQMLDL